MTFQKSQTHLKQFGLKVYILPTATVAILILFTATTDLYIRHEKLTFMTGPSKKVIG